MKWFLNAIVSPAFGISIFDPQLLDIPVLLVSLQVLLIKNMRAGSTMIVSICFVGLTTHQLIILFDINKMRFSIISQFNQVYVALCLWDVASLYNKIVSLFVPGFFIININRYVFSIFFKLFNLIITYWKVNIIPLDETIINIFLIMIHVAGMVFCV